MAPIRKEERHQFVFNEWENATEKIAIYRCLECQMITTSRSLYKIYFNHACKPTIIRYD